MKIESRGRRLIHNTISSVMYQVVSIICGFILPRVILKYYGSGINGLVNSIAQFLAMISFLDLGVAEVVRSSLYRPLAENNNDEISKIVSSSYKFFRKLATILLLYVVALVIIYPIFIKNEYGYLFTASLVVVMSLSSFSEYYFGIPNSLLLSADQKAYIQYRIQIVTLILNTLICFLLVIVGMSIHTVKIVTVSIYLLRPLCLKLYVSYNYNINRKIKYTDEPIKQKWDGAAQHISTVVLNHTDTIVLTVFGTLYDVSIYSVYYLVISGIQNLINGFSVGIKPVFGELWVKNEKEKLDNVFTLIEWGIHTITIFVFGCAAVLIVPFVQVYTLGVDDANYLQLPFGILLTAAYSVNCLRLPYNMMILAASHFKSTSQYYVISTLINVVVSILAIQNFGLVGVTVGTLFAMVFHTFWTAIYCHIHLINRSIWIFIKQIFVDIVIAILGAIFTSHLRMVEISYQGWVILAFKVAIIWLLLSFSVNFFVYRKNINYIVNYSNKNE